MVAADANLPRTETRVRITEIFRSLQGEALTAGLPTVFVRLTGCPLRCQYCDSAYAFHGGRGMDLDDVLDQVAALKTQHVCVTGGEPLAQRACLVLLRTLCDQGYAVSLETSGAIDISQVDPRVSRVVDIKTPGSAECEKNLWSNIDHLTSRDQLKFVICDRHDFDWAVEETNARALADKCVVWVSPSFDQVDPTTLADWLLESGAPLRLQMQLHKALWGDEPGR